MNLDWYRVKLPEAPYGHGLAADYGASRFVSYERDDGKWVTWREDTNGFRTADVVVDDFGTVRKSLQDALQRVHGGRTGNPVDWSSVWRIGTGAVLGAVAGTLLGGLPGIALDHEPLANVGAQTGRIVGAAVGAVLGGASAKDTAAIEAATLMERRSLKARLLR